MQANICVAVKTDGTQCSHRAMVGADRCATHRRVVDTNGPNTTAIKELTYRQRRAFREMTTRWNQQIDAEADLARRDVLEEDLQHEAELLRVQQRREMALLMRHQDDEIRRTGVDPDRPARERRLREDEARRNAHRLAVQGLRDRMAQRAAGVNAEEAALIANAIARADADERARNELAEFARDNQNVHTLRTVNLTKDMVSRILLIPVPNGYKWNLVECSKTPGEIIATCRLTPKAAWQMSAKYCQGENIYEMGEGIYGKVLDGVWQYILQSPDKADLCNCLRQEMEDNIGMCAQGNLSRLCNILAGYMEGIGIQESIADILGRLLPKLMDIDDVPTRLREAFRILKENNVPIVEWKQWVDPLVMDQDDPMEVGFIRNSNDEVVGFIAVVV